MTPLDNDSRTFVLGVWWVELATGEILNIGCYRNSPGVWSVLEVLREGNSATYTDNFKLGGTDDPKEVLAFINNLLEIMSARGFISKIAAFTPACDDPDIYSRIDKLFRAMGLNP